jgi:hypothetical protein
MTGHCNRNRDAPPKAKQKWSRACLFHVRIRIASNTLVLFTSAQSCLNKKELLKPSSAKAQSLNAQMLASGTLVGPDITFLAIQRSTRHQI